MSAALPIGMALGIIGNLYKYSAGPSLGKGAVTCRVRCFLQMMDVQESKGSSRLPASPGSPAVPYRHGSLGVTPPQAFSLPP